MTTNLKPMDIYGDITIPFDVAAYCRGHKFCIEAATLTRTIRQRNEARAAVIAAEKVLDRAEREVEIAIEAARQRMNNDAHV